VRWTGFAVENDRVVDRKVLLQGLIRGATCELSEQVTGDAKKGNNVSSLSGRIGSVGLAITRRYEMNNLRGRVKSWGYAMARASEWGLRTDRLDLSGDRDVEWAWTAAHIPDQPGKVLDLGPATSTTPMISAFKATEVIALDLEPPTMMMTFTVPGLTYIKGDILHGGLPDGQFDTIVNCSTTEHIGLSGRYGSTEDPDGDLKAMTIMRERMSGPRARMVFTIPVGLDSVERPYHRIYGNERLPRILSGFEVVKQAYYAKPNLPNIWRSVSKEVALSVKGSSSFYALGLFVLARR
jgi:Caenorhabditis protein of unknown function, DUF268